MAKHSQQHEKVEREKPEGGKTPHSGEHYQDMWPPNPEPSESAQAKVKDDEAKEQALHGE